VLDVPRICLVLTAFANVEPDAPVAALDVVHEPRTSVDGRAANFGAFLRDVAWKTSR
jgi:hypothetical protein